MIDKLRRLLTELKAGELDVEQALEELKWFPTEDLGFARIDHQRKLRRGSPEVIYSQGKTPAQVAEIFERMAAREANVLATRADKPVFEAVSARVPAAEYNPLARTILLSREPGAGTGRPIPVVAAGTSDLPVAEEAAVTIEALGGVADRITDVGVAGLHRLFAVQDRLRAASVIVVAAGMEGALASVVGGLVEAPIIAVPTSVGYGASFNGLAALLGMLNSCSPGVAVVNIDNGFGAGYMAAAVNRIGAAPAPGSEDTGNATE